jgi:hypothetical protein
VVRVGASAMPFGPIAASGSPEWSYDREALEELRRLAARSGGGARLDLATIWDAPRRIEARSLRAWWLGAAALLLVIEAGVTRWDLRRARRWRFWRA